MEIQEVKVLLKRYITELKCEITGWKEVMPIKDLKHWIKMVDTRIIRKIDDQHIGRS